MVKPQKLSREYLEEILAEVKAHLPGWKYAVLVQAARARAGGRARGRTDGPNFLEKIALESITPRRLRDISDSDVRVTWLRINQWFATATRESNPVEDIVNAAVWTIAEMKRRGFEVDEQKPVARAAAEFAGKGAGVLAKAGRLPANVMVVPDFVSIVGSTAKGKKDARDFDVVIRANWNKAIVEIQQQNVFVPLRNTLDPNKDELLQFISNPQGAHGDNIPLYDLVLRRKATIGVKIVKSTTELILKHGPVVEALKANEDAKRTGVMLSLRVPSSVASKLALEGGESVETLHLTLAYLGKTPELPGDVRERAAKALDRATADFPPMRGKISGVGRFAGSKTSDGMDVFYASFDAPLLSEFRERLVSELRIEGVAPKSDHGFTPHITLAYVDPKKDLPRKALPSLAFVVDAAELVIGNKMAVASFFTGSVAKSFPNRIAEGGVHVHNLERENLKTKKDGTHQHLFFLPDGTRFLSEINGEHEHSLASDTVDETPRRSEGEHTHKVILPPELAERFGAKEVESEKDGPHSHQLQGWSSAFDGVHIHKLIMPDGTVAKNLWPGEYWEHRGKPAQAGVPDAPPAQELAKQEKDVCDLNSPDYDRAACLALRQRQGELVPTLGEPGARVVFVGASPGRVDKARRRAFSGPVGKVFNERYLQPLGLERSDVAIINAVPQLLKDERGHDRQPDKSEIGIWTGWLHEEMHRLQPRIVVALGKTAAAALGQCVDFTLPHPGRIAKFGTNGELKRKLKQIRKALDDHGGLLTCDDCWIDPVSKQVPGAEGGGETRGMRALRTWEDTWTEQLPSSGKGRYTYQHHWRGLDAEKGEDRLTDRQLLNTDHSLHGDIRLEGDDSLWGFAVLIGSAADNKGGDKLLSLKAGDETRLQMANKLQQPKAWLDVGKRTPLVTAPGEVGATSLKSAKFFALDNGTYQLGVARQRAVEVFLKSEKLDSRGLNGRYLLTFAPVGGRRIWLLQRPEDQTPIADRRERDELIREVRARRQKFLVWSKPGQRPEKINVRSGQVVKSALVKIAKADAEKQIIYAVVLDPYQVDAHEDWIPPKDVEDTAHGWFKDSREIDLQHKSPSSSQAVESWVEAYPSKSDYQKAIRGEPHKVYRRKFGDDIVHSGAWIAGVELTDADWARFKSGEIGAFSIKAFGVRTRTTTMEMPRVTFVDLGI